MKKFVTALVVFICLCSPNLIYAQEDQTEENLAKASQNPLFSIISVPFEYWRHDGMAGDASVDAIVAKPVYPMKLGNINLINRLVVPHFWTRGTGFSESGMGNITYQGILTSSQPGKITWGLGPVVDFPTHTNDLGSKKLSVGPVFVALATPGKWVFGGIIQNIWSVAGPGDVADVNEFTFQYFINYNLPDGWYLTSTPIITADWENPSGEEWTVPFGGGIGKLMRFGKQPVDFKIQYFNNVEKPRGGPDWAVQFAVKFLFPKK